MTSKTGDVTKYESCEIKVVVGLGNPGKEYALTRHNLGFLVVQALVDELGGRFIKDTRFDAEVARVRVNDKVVDFVLPQTFMNLSGRSVNKFLHYYKIKPQEMLVVVDDMAIEFGQMRLRLFGGTGGHNGLKSLVECLVTEKYPRLRLGIGQAKHSHTDHVLGVFSEAEKKQLPELIKKAKDTIKRLFHEDFERVARETNRIETPSKEAKVVSKKDPQVRLSQIPEMGQENGNEAN